MRYSAILFDLDGTLIDSTTQFEKACIGAIEKFGYTISKEEFQEIYSTGKFIDVWIAKHSPSDPDGIRTERDRKYSELLEESIEFCVGAEEMIESLGDHPRAIVTAAKQEFVDAIDRQLHLSKFFDVIITRKDTTPERMKPDPYGIELAVQRLRVAAKDCVYVGDQPFDAQAAEKARVPFVLVRSIHTPKNFAHSPEIASLRDLPSLL